MAKKKESLFEILKTGLMEYKLYKEGKITLRTHEVKTVRKKILPKVEAKLIVDTRKKLHVSRGVFAMCLRVSPRTLEKWEQGLAKPNSQAAALILLVRKYPDTLERLEKI